MSDQAPLWSGEIEPGLEIRREAARIAGRVFQGAGEAVYGDRFLGLLICLELYLAKGTDKAADALGWNIEATPAEVVSIADRLRVFSKPEA